MSNQSFTRRTDVVIRIEGDETLVLDPASQTVHCLSGDTAAVWNATGSSTTAVGAATGLGQDAVGAAVATLDELGLLTAPAGLSRRSLVQRGAVLGGAAVAASAVSLVLPEAAMASSVPVVTVTGDCNVNGNGTSTFTISAAGGFLDNTSGNQLYKVTLVYAAWNGPVSGPGAGTAYTWYSVKFTCTTNGAGKPDASSVVKTGGTDTGAAVAAGTGSRAGFITITTSHPVTGVLLPSDLNIASKFNGGALQTGSAGNVYLQFVPSWSGGKGWAGYTSVQGCYAPPTGTPYPPAWPTDYTT